jgi:hypothetical protein
MGGGRREVLAAGSGEIFSERGGMRDFGVFAEGLGEGRWLGVVF